MMTTTRALTRQNSGQHLLAPDPFRVWESLSPCCSCATRAHTSHVHNVVTGQNRQMLIVGVTYRLTSCILNLCFEGGGFSCLTENVSRSIPVPARISVVLASPIFHMNHERFQHGCGCRCRCSRSDWHPPQATAICSRLAVLTWQRSRCVPLPQ